MNDNQPAGAPEHEEDFEKMFEQGFQQQARFEPGQMVEAPIVKISPEWIFLGVGAKGEGLLDRKEMLDDAGNLTVKEGDRVHAYYMRAPGHELRFTTRLGAGPVGHSQLAHACQSGIPVEGTVAKEVKGGFEVKVRGGARAFCPFSQMGLRREESQSDCVGKSFLFKITECGERNIVLTRREFADQERQARARDCRESLKEGMRVKGTVTSIQKFGAFVDLGGIDGLLPVSELAWGRTENVADVLSVGQAVEVAVKRIDWESNRISLSLKDTLPDPWDRAAQTWPVGSYHDGTVTRLTPFGAFVALGDGVEGLIHISKLGAGRRIHHPRDVLQEGQGIEVKVEAVDRASRRLSLSLAALSRAQEEEEAALQAYREQSAQTSQSLGTLGELLKAKLARKEQGKE